MDKSVEERIEELLIEIRDLLRDSKEEIVEKKLHTT
jgi:hypothetical protein